MRPAMILTVGVMLFQPVTAAERDRELRCEEIKQEIREIHSKMRAGYTRAQGEKLEARLRKLRALRAKACR